MPENSQKMVLNKRDLERAFSPNKHHKSLGQRRILNKSNNGRDASNQISSSMRVVVRIRPQNAKELEKSARSVIRVADENMLIFDPKEETEPFFFHGSRQNCRDIQKRQNKDLDFAFDRVFDPNSPNEAVFEGSTKDIVKSLLDGYNCSVFAYGATGAGKTYTMLGSKTSPGITYLTIVELYRQIETLINEREFDLAVSHLEVYNENVQDLIQPSGPLHVREDGMSGVQIPGLSVHRITNADDLFALMAQGNKNRTQHPTDANAESSRSHSVFQLYVRMTNKLDRSIKMVKLSMIDLAGSERASATGCQGMRFTEGANINRSLLALGNCINCLADGRKHIPYRDSKLTRLLKDSLGGNCQTVMIANVSLSSSSYEDTYNTLKYATRAKKIKQMVKKNIVTVQLNASQYSKVVASLTEENEKLKQRLKMYEAEAEKGATAPVVPPEVLPSYKDQLLLPYKELETMNREISKLVKEIKLLKWRNVVKQKIADRLPCLSIDTFQMRKRLDRLRTSMRQLEGREISFKQKLRETCMKRNECLKNTNCLVKKLDENGTNIQLQQHVVNLHLQLELQERNLQLEHCQQLLSMQQNELESEDVVLKQICSFLKEYHFLLHGHNLTTEAMMSNYEELVRRLEGFKHISWKNDQETDDICNFTFSVAEFSRQNLCSEVITNTEISNKASTGGTLKVTSGNGTVAGPDSNIGVTDMCMMLKTASEDDNVPRSQTSLPENTELSEAEGTKDKTAECCGILKETNLVVGCVQNIAPHFVMPVEVGCDVTVSNSCSIVDASLNNTFVLPSGPSSHFQNKGPRSFSDGSNSQHKIQNTADNSACSKKRRGHNEHSGKLCNKENRATAMELIPQASTVSKSPMYRLTPHSRHYQDPVTLGGAAMKLKSSASYQRGGYNSNKCQLYTPAGSMYGLTPRSKHYQDHVSMKALGRKTYLNQRRQLSRGYPYVN